MMNNSPSNNGLGRNESGMMHPFSKILNDKSITNLMDAGL
jgi:hypothetical protein